MFNFFRSKPRIPEDESATLRINVPSKDLPVKTLTAEEMALAVKKRIEGIQDEFIDGFSFIQNYPKSVTFFGSARLPETDPYYEKARSLAGRLAREGYAIFSGGGPGIMEAANRGAQEAGGDSLGLTIELPMEQSTNPYVTGHVDFYYFFTRKVCMTYSSEAFICFPGGFGTLDEFFEILTLVQTKKVPRVPIILVGVDFWRPLLDWMDSDLRQRFHTVDPSDTNLYYLLDDEDLITSIIKEVPVRSN